MILWRARWKALRRLQWNVQKVLDGRFNNLLAERIASILFVALQIDCCFSYDFAAKSACFYCKNVN